MANQPQPEIPDVPEPDPIRHVTCPSCASVYAPATQELVTDSGLALRVRQAEEDSETWRRAAQDLQTQLDAAKLRLAQFEEIPEPAPEPEPTPAPKRKRGSDFLIG